MKWQQNTRLVTIACSAMSAAVAAGVTYVSTAKVLEKKMQENLKEELEKSRVYYQNLYSTPVFVADTDADIPPTEELLEEVRTEAQGEEVVDLVGQALEKARVYQGVSKEEPEDKREMSIVNNVFANHQPPGEEVLTALLATRDPDEPYIITKHEFYSNEDDLEQGELTYYEGDGVLVFDNDEYNPVDSERLVGDENLLRFGYGSGDEYVVYVCNMTIDPPMVLHITRSPDKYRDVVMGLDDDEPHLQHSQLRKFRMRDE